MHKIQISIPKPCHENWNTMTTAEQGRYCGVCAKVVVDFGSMTDAEVLNFFNKATIEKICGSAYPDQLNRAIGTLKPAKPFRLKYWNYAAALFLFFAKSKSAKAQLGVMAVTYSKTPTKPTNKNATIKGKIIDEYGNPIAFASIKVVKTNISISADSSGNFTFKGYRNADSITVSALGYTTKNISLMHLNNYNITLVQEINLLEPVIVQTNVDYRSCRRIAGEIQSYSTIQKTTRTIIADTLVAIKGIITPIKIYPNPVQKGNNFSLTFSKKLNIENYIIQITNSTGLVVLRKQIVASEKQITTLLQADVAWASGIYYISLFDKENKIRQSGKMLLH